MDSEHYREIVEWKLYNRLPDGLTKHQRFVIKRRAESFVLQGDSLWYICRRRQDRQEHLAKVVTTAAEANAIFEEFHCSALGAHCGVEKTHHAVIARYYWPGMEADIRQWISQCPHCQAKQVSLKEKCQYNPIQVTEPFEMVGMDLMRLTKTEGGHQYICVMVDYFTKWAESYPLKTKTADEVTMCILDFIYKFGAPQRLLTDQGSEFKNQVNLNLCKKLGIERVFCAPYHPQTNGLVEKLNGTIQRSLNKLARDKPTDWDKFLQSTMFALRTKKQLTTKYSPYFLLFGREARYPSQVPLEYEVTTERAEMLVGSDEQFQGLATQPIIYKTARDNVLKTQQRVAKRKAREGVDDEFMVGDLVLKKNVKEQERKGGKLARDMLGPYKITKIQEKVVSLSAKGETSIANVDHLKKYIEPQERVPARLKKVSNSAPTGRNHPHEKPSLPLPSPSGNSDSSQALDKISSIDGEIIWSKIGPYKLFTEDVRGLGPGRELESEVMNAYLQMLSRRAPHPTAVIDTFEMTAIWKGTSKGLRKLDVADTVVLLGAVCEEQHWTLVVMYPNDGKAILIDPFGATTAQLKQCCDSTRAFLRKKKPNIGRWTAQTVTHPRQQDSTSCGVIVCKAAEALLLKGDMDFGVDESSILEHRREMAQSLIENSDDLTDLCRSCGERDISEGPVTDWVECSNCEKWFHCLCVGDPNTGEDFFCPAC